MSKTKYKWTATIKRENLKHLQELAAGLGFIVRTPSGLYGSPAPAAMLDALAVAYERDPGGVHLALKVLGVVADPDSVDE